MSITDSAPSSAPLGKPAKAPQRNPNRIRRGQKLDEILSLSELRLNEFASSSSESTFDPSSSSTPSAGSSPFQLQEYLSLLVRRDPHAVETITSLPSETDISIDDSPFQNVDTDIWVYEQLRRLVLDLTTPWLTALQTDCSKHLKPTTCAAMNAGDWMYLCASHGEEKQCCAIDYMVHTLDVCGISDPSHVG
uniref:Uncharacterized protein n=1 Tax=Kalmanozyma brasiliensis (strain GHG001) TaxID=1365824 RepID=V5EVX3_KALBG